MPIDLTTIPAERLAMLDTATLYHGSHTGQGGPDCKHCAREFADTGLPTQDHSPEVHKPRFWLPMPASRFLTGGRA